MTAILLGVTTASAQRVLLVESAETHRLAARLRAELTSIGFEVEVEAEAEAARGAAPDRWTLEDAARAANAVAALRVQPSRGIEIWVMDRATSKTLARELVLAGDDGDSAVALGAVELLRARLLEVEEKRLATKSLPPTPLPQPLVPRGPATPTLTLAIGVAAAWSPGGLGPTPHVDGWVRLRASSHVALTTRILIPTLPATIDAREGHATVTHAGAALGADVVLLPEDSRLRLRTGAGLGILWMHMSGTARPAEAYLGRSDDVAAPLSFVHIGASVALSGNIRLFADATAALATPRPVIVFADRTVASWGQPAILLTVGLELPVLF